MNAAAEQREVALARANEIRLARAALKRALAAREAPFLPVLTDPPDYVETATLEDALRWIPGWGPGKAERLPRDLGMSPTRRLRDLTERQRLEVVEFLRDKGIE